MWHEREMSWPLTRIFAANDTIITNAMESGGRGCHCATPGDANASCSPRPGSTSGFRNVDGGGRAFHAQAANSPNCSTDSSPDAPACMHKGRSQRELCTRADNAGSKHDV